MTRVALTFPGRPSAAARWSGIPSGLRGGLEQAGVEVADVGVELPPPLLVAVRAALQLRYRDRHVALVGPELAALRTRAAARRLARAGALDGVVQIGTGYSLASGAPLVTYEDMTVVQAARLYPQWRALPAAGLRARVERQRRAYAAARGCCAATRWAARSIVEDYGVPEAKVHVVGVGANHDPGTAERDWSVPRFLFVGREWERKNGPLVVRAFARLRAELPRATLDVVGGHPPLDVPGVRGHGLLRLSEPAERARVEELFRAATCFVMPSQHEPAGIVYVEAAAAGVASIATSAGGAEVLVGEAGVLVDPGDEDALLAAMRRLAEPDVARRLGALARERAELFTWRRVAERVLRALAPAGVDVADLAEPLAPP